MDRSNASTDELIDHLQVVHASISRIRDQISLASDEDREDKAWMHRIHYALRKKKHEARCVQTELAHRNRKKKRENSESLRFMVAAKEVLSEELYRAVMREAGLTA